MSDVDSDTGIALRKATGLDLRYMVELSLRGIEERHFRPYPEDEYEWGEENDRLTTIITEGIYPNKGSTPVLKAEAYILESDSEPVGYFTFRDAPYASIFPGKEVVQLYEIILHPDHRGLGYGTHAVDAVIGMFSEEAILTAHVRPASRLLRWMLRRRHFREIGSFGGAYVLVKGSGSVAAKLAIRLKKVLR